MPRYRVLCTKAEREQFPTEVKVEASYPKFCIVSGPDEAIAELKLRYLVEPYETRERKLRSFAELSENVPQTTRSVLKPKRSSIIRVTFVAPVKKAWLTAMEKLGASLLDFEGNATVVLRAPSKKVREAVSTYSHVSTVEDYQPDIKVSAGFIRNVRGLAPLATESIDEMRNSLSNSDTPKMHKPGSILPGCVQAVFLTAQYARSARKELDALGVKLNLPKKSAHLIAVLDRKADTEAQLQLIAQTTGLKFIEHVPYYQLTNDVARGILAGGFVDLSSFGLDGEGEIVGIADSGLDTGNALSLHPDFLGRVVDLRSYPIDFEKSELVAVPGADDGSADTNTGHGTHVAGSIVGNGARATAIGLPSRIQGMAPRAQLVFQAIEQKTDWSPNSILQFLIEGKIAPPFTLFGIPANLENLFQPAYDMGARIHSNSWGGGEAGAYNKGCGELDQFVWSHKDFLVVVAAGNDGTAADSGQGTVEPGSVTSPGIAKNCLTVGATESIRPVEFNVSYGSNWPDRFPTDPLNSDPMSNNSDDIAAFSSRGPCLSGRRKPDVVAPGTFVLSTRSSQITTFGWGRYAEAPDDYMYLTGTSMATPLVSGCAVLVREHLRKNIGIANPSAALLKATIIHSAHYLSYRFRHASSMPFADNEQGWGRVNLASILTPQAQEKVSFIDSDGLTTGTAKDFLLDVPTANGRLRITLVYTDFPGELLVNNLNLLVLSPDGTTYCGNDFAGTGVLDTRNNVEGVVVPAAPAGQWKISIIGSEVLQGPQDFALVITGADATLV